jgi:Reverse transcriptase (RNA-dependent DNA polymerase)
MLVLYVYDVIITGDDEEEIAQLKVRLSKEFEIKNLSLFRYFLGIENSRSGGNDSFSKKHALDLLKKTSMLG